MKEYQINVFNVKTGKKIDTFIMEFPSVSELKKFMHYEIQNYNEPYFNLNYDFYKY